MMQLPVIVYGNGDLYREIFNAIASTLSDSGYGALLKIAILLTASWAIVRFSIERSMMPMLRWLALYYVLFFIILEPKVTLEIIDRIHPGAIYTVDNVPLGLGMMANLSSSIGDGLTELTEKNFTLPNDLQYEKTGLVMASRLALASTQFQITDPNMAQSLEGFVKQCVFYDLLLNKYSWNDLFNTPDLWSFVRQKASPARAFLYVNNQTSEIVSCRDGAQALAQNWNQALQDTAAHYGGLIFPNSVDAKKALLSYLPTSYQFLSNISEGGMQILTQNVMQNALQNGLLQMSAATDAPAAIEAYSFSKAQLQKRLTNSTVGDMAAYWLPLMKNVLEAMLYGSFVFVLLLILFPFGPSVLKNYVGSLLWLQLWAPLYAILNLFMNFYAQHGSVAAVGGAQNLTLLSQTGFAQVNADVASLAGYLSLSVPLLAAGLVKGLMSVFGQAAQYIAGVTQGAASSAASEAAAGNLSAGNFNYSNHSSFNTSANHFDTSGRVFSGMFTTQMAGGSTLSLTPDGNSVMNNQGAISSLGTSVNLADSLRSSYMEHAEHAKTAAVSHAHAYSAGITSSMRSLFELGDHQASSTGDNHAWSISSTGQVSQAIQTAHRLTQRFAQSHNVSFEEAANVLAAASGNLSGGVSAGLPSLPGKIISASVGGSVGLRRDSSSSDSMRHGSLYSDAIDYVRDTNFSQHLDVVGRAAADHSLRSGNDEGKRLIDHLGSSWDHAQSARHEMVSSLQEAESFRQGANFTQDHAVSINSNANQVVFDALQNQGYSPAAIEQMMVHEPEHAQQLVNNAVHAYSESVVAQWQQDLPQSMSAVSNTYEHQNASVPGLSALSASHHQDHQQVENRAKAEGLDRNDLIDSGIESQTENSLQKFSSAVKEIAPEIQATGHKVETKVNKEEAKQQGSIWSNMFHGIDTKGD